MNSDPDHIDEWRSKHGPGSTVGAEWVPQRAVIALLAVVLLTAALLLYCTWAFWPSGPTAPGAPAPALGAHTRVAFLGTHISATQDIVLFVIVAASGALGGLIHTIRSLSWYLGNRYLRWSWVPFYLLLPVVGASGATVFYLVFRAGLFSPSTNTAEVNPFGFAAVASLVGLFSEQALEKLQDVFGSLLAPARAGSDTIHREPGAQT
jgi:hypothetical protein